MFELNEAIFDEKIFQAAKALWGASRFVSKVSMALAIGACAVAVLAYGVKTLDQGNEV